MLLTLFLGAVGGVLMLLGLFVAFFIVVCVKDALAYIRDVLEGHN